MLCAVALLLQRPIAYALGYLSHWQNGGKSISGRRCSFTIIDHASSQKDTFQCTSVPYDPPTDRSTVSTAIPLRTISLPVSLPKQSGQKFDDPARFPPPQSYIYINPISDSHGCPLFSAEIVGSSTALTSCSALRIMIDALRLITSIPPTTYGYTITEMLHFNQRESCQSVSNSWSRWMLRNTALATNRWS